MASEHEYFDPSEGVEQRDWRRQLSEGYSHPEMKRTPSCYTNAGPYPNT